jgi:hypothetical protein
VSDESNPYESCEVCHGGLGPSFCPLCRQTEAKLLNAHLDNTDALVKGLRADVARLTAELKLRANISRATFKKLGDVEYERDADHTSSDREDYDCDECDGSGVVFYNGKPEPCYPCAESIDFEEAAALREEPR